MTFFDFLRNVVRWRITGGHADELRRLGVQSSQATPTLTAGNAALSDAVFPALTTGSNNTAVGKGALKNLTGGANNFAIGKDSGTDAMVNIVAQNNVGALGNNTTTTIYSKVSLTVTSDERDKTQFAPIPWDLSMLKQVKIGSFRFRDRQTGELLGPVRYGFSAQNLSVVEQQATGANVLVDGNDPNNLKLRESMLVPVLFLLVQQLAERVETLEAQQPLTQG